MNENSRLFFIRGNDKGRNIYEDFIVAKSDLHFFWECLVKEIKEAGKLEILENPKVLDLGGGVGEFSKNLNTQGIDCISLDRRNLNFNPGAKQVRADAEKIPFLDESFHIVYERGVFDKALYHNNLSILFKEIYRVLKKEGVLCICEGDPLTDQEYHELSKYFIPLNSNQTFLSLWEKN